MKKNIIFTFLFLWCGYFGFSQDKFVIQNKKGVDKVKFRLINNLIIIPVEVNGVTLSFLLDTGVSKPIIFNFLNVSDTLKIKDTETIYLRGLGGGESVEALKSRNNIFKIGDAIKLSQDLYAVYNVNLNLAPKLGFPVHGIIGFDLFEDLIVEINYAMQTIVMTEPNRFEDKPCKSCQYFGLEFYNKKPYIRAEVEMNQITIPVKLLIDSGSSDALWLFENDSLGLKPSRGFFIDFLGHGLNGSIYGKRSKVDQFSLKSFRLKYVNVSYPNREYIHFAQKIENRNGSLGGNILKRFNVIFHYKKRLLTLKKNKLFNEKFSYNKSGIELSHAGTRLVKEVDNSRPKDSKGLSSYEAQNTLVIKTSVKYKLELRPAFVIVELRANSPAEIAGLQKGDMLLSINGKDTKQFSLQQITQMFYGDNEKKIKLKVDRDGRELTFSFLLKALF